MSDEQRPDPVIGAALEKELARIDIRALLRQVEWAATIYGGASEHSRYAGSGHCPVCGGGATDGHAPDCRLKVALEGRDV